MTTIQIKDGNGNLLTVPVLPIGQQTSANSVSHVMASDVGPYSVTATPTITAIGNTSSVGGTSYNVGQVLGGLLTFANTVNPTTLSATIDSVVVTSKTPQPVGGFRLYLFKANPSNSTWTDRATPAISNTDLTSLIGVYSLEGTDDTGLGGGTLYQSTPGVGAGNSPKVMVLGNTSLYGVLTVAGAPLSFYSNSDISVTVNVLKY